MNRATRELEWTSLRTGGESKREGISRKRRATVGDVRVVRIVRDGESVWVLWRLTWMWLRTFGLMSSLRPQAEKIRASLQPFDHRSRVEFRLKVPRLAWAIPQRCARQ